jgi:hypothetical protein
LQEKEQTMCLSCAAHIMHNALRTSADILLTDVGAINIPVFPHIYRTSGRIKDIL